MASNPNVKYYTITINDGTINHCSSLAELSASLRISHPGGVNQILIGAATTPGYKIVPNSKGIIAILIGLLLPAIQKAAAPHSPDILSLRGNLAANGKIGFALADGSVSQVEGPQSGVGFLRSMDGGKTWVL